MKFNCTLLCTAAMLSAPALAQDMTPEPIVARRAAAPVTAVATLPANTPVALTLNQTLTSRGQRTREGDTFSLTVANDVRLGDYVVIPRGSRAMGEVTWLTGKGMFGKSGKMDIELRWVEVGGQRYAIEGSFRQEGEGNTVATVAGVVAVPVAGLFITGRSAVIPQGRELEARTVDPIPVQLPPGEAVPVPAEAPPEAGEPLPDS